MKTAKRILLVDDDSEFLEANRDLLEAHGYDVVTASSGEEGLARAKAERPDLILLDVMMASDTEGFDVSRRMKDDAALRGLPILLLTGIRKAMNLPFRFEPDDEWLPVKAVLEKPIPPASLLEAVAKWVR